MSASPLPSDTSGRDQPSPPPSRTTGKPKGCASLTTDAGRSTGPAIKPSQHRRHCSQAACSKTLPSASHDAHTVCIACRRIAGLQCSTDSRCNECCSWSADQVQAAHSFQIKLGKSKAKGKGSSASDKLSAPSPSVDTEPQIADNDQANQQLASLVSGSAFKEVLTSLITDTVKSLLPDMSHTASSEARHMRTTAGLRGPLSAPTSERYLRSPVGSLRGVMSGPEPTGVGVDEIPPPQTTVC